MANPEELKDQYIQSVISDLSKYSDAAKYPQYAEGSSKLRNLLTANKGDSDVLDLADKWVSFMKSLESTDIDTIPDEKADRTPGQNDLIALLRQVGLSGKSATDSDRANSDAINQIMVEIALKMSTTLTKFARDVNSAWEKFQQEEASARGADFELESDDELEYLDSSELLGWIESFTSDEEGNPESLFARYIEIASMKEEDALKQLESNENGFRDLFKNIVTMSKDKDLKSRYDKWIKANDSEKKAQFAEFLSAWRTAYRTLLDKIREDIVSYKTLATNRKTRNQANRNMISDIGKRMRLLGIKPELIIKLDNYLNAIRQKVQSGEYQWGGEYKYQEEARDRINAKFNQRWGLENIDLLNTIKGLLPMIGTKNEDRGRKIKEVWQMINEPVEALIFEATSGIYMFGHLEEEAEQPKVNQYVLQYLSSELEERKEKVKTSIKSMIESDAKEAGEKRDAYNDNLSEVEKLFVRSKELVRGVNEIHKVNRTIHNKANAVTEGSNDKVKSYMDYIRGLSVDTRRYMTRFIKRFTLEGEERSDMPDKYKATPEEHREKVKENPEYKGNPEALEQAVATYREERSQYLMQIKYEEMQRLFYSQIFDQINANGGVIPKELLMDVSKRDDRTGLDTTENPTMRTFIDALFSRMGCKNQDDRNKVTMLAWTFLSAEQISGNLTERLAKSRVTRVETSPWENRPQYGLIGIVDPRHRLGKDTFLGSAALGFGGAIDYGTEFLQVFMESIPELIESHTGGVYKPKDGVTGVISLLKEFGVKNPQQCAEWMVNSFVGSESHVYAAHHETGIGVPEPAFLKELTEAMLRNTTAFEIPSSEAEYESMREKLVEKQINETDRVKKIVIGMQIKFLDKIALGQTDTQLSWSERMSELGVSLFRHGRLQTAMKQYLKNLKPPIKEDDLTYQQYLDMISGLGNSAEVMDFVPEIARKQVVARLMFTIATGDGVKTKTSQALKTYYYNWEQSIKNHPLLAGLPSDDDERVFAFGKYAEKMLDRHSLTQLINDFETEGNFATKVLASRRRDGAGDRVMVSFATAWAEEMDTLHARYMQSIDPGELLQELIIHLPWLAEGYVEIPTGDVAINLDGDGRPIIPTGVETKRVDAFDFYFGKTDHTILFDAAGEKSPMYGFADKRKLARYEALKAFNGWKNSPKAGESVERAFSNMEHVEYIMGMFSGLNDTVYDHNFPEVEYLDDDTKEKKKKREPIKENRIGQEEILKAVSEIVHEARYGRYEDGKLKKEPFMIKDSKTGKWTVKEGLNISDYLENEDDASKSSTDGSIRKSAYLALLRNEVRKKMFSEENNFFKYFYENGNGRYQSDQMGGIWQRFSTLSRWGQGENALLPVGTVDTLARLDNSDNVTFTKQATQAEIITSVQNIFAEAKDKVGGVLKSGKQKDIPGELLKVHTEMNEKLKIYYSPAEKDKWQIDLYRLVCRLVGENMRLRGVWGVFAGLTIRENVSLTAYKKPVSGAGQFAIDMQGMENYALALMDAKVITLRGLNILLGSMQNTPEQRMFSHIMTLYGSAGLLYFMAWSINDAYTKAQEDAGVDISGGGGKGK